VCARRETVKTDKDREFYLGASVKASVGRWQKGKDILWYTRGKEGASSAADELAAVKDEEERVRCAHAGLPGSSHPSAHSRAPGS
jgi:hypothetical protein